MKAIINNKITIILSWIVVFAYSFSVKENREYIIKFKSCDTYVSPMDILFESKQVGSVFNIRPLNATQCIGLLKVKDDFVITKNMMFCFQKPFIGDFFLEIKIDSSIKISKRHLAYEDTLEAN